MTGGGEEGTTLEYTPTWVVAAVCTVIVAISLAVERFLHYSGKVVTEYSQIPHFSFFEFAFQFSREIVYLNSFTIYSSIRFFRWEIDNGISIWRGRIKSLFTKLYKKWKKVHLFFYYSLFIFLFRLRGVCVFCNFLMLKVKFKFWECYLFLF